MAVKRMQRPLSVALLALAVCSSTRVAWGQGVILTGVGPVNRSMAGASTAAPIDAAGALRWNPASMSGLAQSEVTFGAELLLQTETLYSSAGGLSGVTKGEPGTALIPEVALVHKKPDSPWTLGLGMFGIAGFKANYPASTTNPISLPQPLGLGRIFAELEVFEIVPTVSYAITPRLAIGVSPSLGISRLSADPLFLVSPDDANGDTAPTYPPGLGTRYHYGGGAQVGVYYIADGGWHFGASVKSPMWFEDFRFFSEDELGGPRHEKLDFDLPMIVSLGVACNARDWLLWAVDVRYFDYKNTNGFRTAGFDATGAGTGLGWSNVFSVSTGLQLTLTERLLARFGYTYQQNPISESDTFFNVASPLILSHIMSVGFSWYLTDNLIFNAVYLHAFEAENTGPMLAPGVGAIPDTSVTSQISADALGMGFTVRY